MGDQLAVDAIGFCRAEERDGRLWSFFIHAMVKITQKMGWK